MSQIREKFVAAFGEDQASALIRAAEEHENGVNSANKGSDPFKWALLICIGYECISRDRFREYHGITASWEQLRQWIKDHADSELTTEIAISLGIMRSI
jgi:hypothetical protein